VGDANANCPQIFKNYRSEFTKTRYFKRKIPFFWEEAPRTLPGGPHSSPQTKLPIDLPVCPPKNCSHIYAYAGA